MTVIIKSTNSNRSALSWMRRYDITSAPTPAVMTLARRRVLSTLTIHPRTRTMFSCFNLRKSSNRRPTRYNVSDGYVSDHQRKIQVQTTNRSKDVHGGRRTLCRDFIQRFDTHTHLFYLFVTSSESNHAHLRLGTCLH